MHPRDITPDSVGCLVVKNPIISVLGLPRWDCAFWEKNAVWVAVLIGPTAPSFRTIEIHRGIFPHMWSPLPAKPTA